ncbi:MAG: hypothetical protein P0S93_03940 [Candidatus Neptunochlamydia sp.]|nr:hypothetical protein [Candidatus Neptunochlamydia sp.]
MKKQKQVELPDGSDQTSLNIFQRFAILDLILGNLDRKLDNWIVKLEKKTGQFEQINANCFPRGHLPAVSKPIQRVEVNFSRDNSRSFRIDLAQKNQYQSKTLPIAQHKLTETRREFVLSLTENKI